MKFALFQEVHESVNTLKEIDNDGEGTDSPDSPVGRLKSAESKRKTAGTNDYIMRVVFFGYNIPFKEVMTNNKSARDTMEFVKDKILKLVQKASLQR